MGCCAAKRRPGTWSPNPLLGFRQGYFPGFVPAIGDVDTSAGAVASKRPGGSCCDACETEHSRPAAEESGCSTGACGINQFTAGMRLPLSEYSVNARQRQAGATMDQQASAWTEAAFGGRQAGIVTPVGTDGVRTFRRSTAIDLMALSDLELSQRESDLQDVDLRQSDGATAIAEYRAELTQVRSEMDRRDLLNPPDDDGGLSPDDDPTERPLTEAEFQEKKRELAEGVADRLEPGDDPASRARRDAIVANAISGTLQTFNTFLQREYDAQVTTINAGRDITLQTLRNEDRQREREYQIQLRQLGGQGLLGGGGGGGGAIVGIGLVGLLLSMAKK